MRDKLRTLIAQLRLVSGGENPRKDGGSIAGEGAGGNTLVASGRTRVGHPDGRVRRGDRRAKSPRLACRSLSGPALVWLPLTGWGRPNGGVTGRVGIFGEV